MSDRNSDMPALEETSKKDPRYVAIVGPLRARNAVLRLLDLLEPGRTWASPVFVARIASAPDSPVHSSGYSSTESGCQPQAFRPLVVAAEELDTAMIVARADDLRAVVIVAEIAPGSATVGSFVRPALPEGCAAALVLAAVVTDGAGSTEAAGDAASRAGLQVAVRRAALEHMGGCAVVIMRAPGGQPVDHDGTPANDVIATPDPDSASAVRRPRRPRVRLALEALVTRPGVPLDGDLLGLHAGDLCSFSAHSGWDASRKIQVVLDASGIDVAPTLEIVDGNDRGGDANGGDSAENGTGEDKGDDEVDEDDEQAWLQHFGDLCRARAKEVEAERARKASAATGGNATALPSRASTSVRQLGSAGASQAATSSTSGQNRSVPAGSGAQFFRQMFSADK